MCGFARFVLASGVALVMLHAGPATAQTEKAAAAADRWQLTLDAEQYLWDVRLVKVAGDTLVVRQSDSLVNVPVGRITEMRMIQKSEMQVGGGDGRGVMSALTGSDDEVYDFATLEFAERLRAVQKILSYHPPGE